MSDDVFAKHGTLTHVVLGQRMMRLPRAIHVYGTLLLIGLSFAYSAGGADALMAKPATRPTSSPTTQAVSRSAAARAVLRFHDLLKLADAPGATALLAASPEPVRDADRRIKRLVGTVAGPDSDFSILDALETGDVAVVLINDYLKGGRKTIDIKPWYLLRQQGEWKLLGKFTDFELKEYGFDEGRLIQYRALEKWAERRESELRKEQPDCGC
ncbi:MAG: hypothetical protein JWN40_3153 [Phycisphaerales bacterium]|nr:hypothetical protein [Phycisphaerales bacterium]